MASGRHHDQRIHEAIDEFIARKKPSMGKVLLVTEFIETGASINSIAERLDRQDIDFDIASASVSSRFFNHKTNKGLRSLLERLRYGTVGKAGLAFYFSQSSTGVIKDLQSGSAHPAKREGACPRTLSEARQDMKLMATEILKLIQE